MTAIATAPGGPVEIDVAIVGGGMVGASFALALLGTGIRVLLVEGVAPDSSAQPSFDERTTALGNASRRIFEGLGVWNAIAPEAAAIRTIHVSDAGRFGFSRLRAQEQGIDAFGYVVANRAIGSALWQRLGAAAAGDLTLRVPARVDAINITSERVQLSVVGGSTGVPGVAPKLASAQPVPGQPTPGAPELFTARLVVAADGAHSNVRAAAGIHAEVEDYGQVAIVAGVGADRPHDGTAYERFTPSGPLAVLPLRGGGYGVIWSCTPQRAGELLALDDVGYLQELQARFGWRAGRFVRIGRRVSYPLKLSRAAATVGTRTVLIGNAAQALHPVAGQGFNLGLRDAAMLAEVLANAGAVGARVAEAGGDAGTSDAGGPGVAPADGAGPDLGSPQLLRRFAAWRVADRSGVIRFTDGLVRLFGSHRPGVGILRNLGLLMFDLAPPAKSALARVSAGFGGPTPRLARGLGVREVQRP